MSAAAASARRRRRHELLRCTKTLLSSSDGPGKPPATEHLSYYQCPCCGGKTVQVPLGGHPGRRFPENEAPCKSCHVAGRASTKVCPGGKEAAYSQSDGSYVKVGYGRNPDGLYKSWFTHTSPDGRRTNERVYHYDLDGSLTKKARRRSQVGRFTSETAWSYNPNGSPTQWVHRFILVGRHTDEQVYHFKPNGALDHERSPQGNKRTYHREKDAPTGATSEGQQFELVIRGGQA